MGFLGFATQKTPPEGYHIWQPHYDWLTESDPIYKKNRTHAHFGTITSDDELLRRNWKLCSLARHQLPRHMLPGFGVNAGNGRPQIMPTLPQWEAEQARGAPVFPVPAASGDPFQAFMMAALQARQNQPPVPPFPAATAAPGMLGSGAAGGAATRVGADRPSLSTRHSTGGGGGPATMAGAGRQLPSARHGTGGGGRTAAASRTHRRPKVGEERFEYILDKVERKVSQTSRSNRLSWICSGFC